MMGWRWFVSWPQQVCARTAGVQSQNLLAYGVAVGIYLRLGPHACCTSDPACAAHSALFPGMISSSAGDGNRCSFGRGGADFSVLYVGQLCGVR